MVPATVILAALAATNPGARDTTFVVPEGARIEIEHREGDIRVMGAASREARVVLDDDDGRIRVQSSGGTIRLGSSPSGDGADLLIYLPEDVDVSVGGQEGDVTVAGIVGGSVSVRTADGDVEIDGGAGVSEGDPAIAYCRIGERSSHTWFVLKYLLGHEDVKNYDGSWTEYGSLIGVPIET